MIKTLKKLNLLLDKKQKRFCVILLLMMLFGALLETASVAAIIPVIELLMDTEAVTTNRFVAPIYNALGMDSPMSFATMTLIALIMIFVLKNLYLFLQQKLLYRFIYTNQFRTSERMMKNYMRRDYEYFLNADTAVIQRSITSDVNNMYALLLAILQLISESIVFVFLVTVLFMAEPLMTLMIAVLLILTLLIIKRCLKPMLKKAGEDNQEYYSGLFKWISQSVAGIKEIKTNGREQFFVDEYIRCGDGYVNAVQKYTLYSNVPRLLIETVCVTAMVLYMLFLMHSNRDATQMVGILGAFSVAMMRLMPCANRINNQLNSITYFEPFLKGVSENLQDEISGERTDMSEFTAEVQKLPLRDKIELKDICYHYPNTEVEIFDHAELTIPVGKSVGIVGSSGAGKSTVVDILLGMLKLRGGSITVDGKDILAKENYRGWLRNVGYIPQSIFMLDDTIRRNVAFGVPEEKMSEERIWQVLKDAQLDEFVRGLPEGLDTGIGERGVRLSGGQRQRIGIARALYEDPEVLILDEATSALDNDTESAIMDSINRFQGEKTLIIIAHRLQTIEKCDMVYRVDQGRIIPEQRKEKG